MTRLTDSHCQACRADAVALTEAEINRMLDEIPEWQLVSGDGMPTLQRVYRFDNYVDAVAFTNRVAEIAEAEDHHPAILTEWGRVTVSWWTHKINGLHENDFIMAAKTDQLMAV